MTGANALDQETRDLPDGYRPTELGPLPEEWRVVRLGEVVSLRNGTVSPSDAPESRYVGLEHLDSGEICIKRYGYALETRSAKSIFNPGDILYGKLRPYLDKSALAEWPGVCSTDILVLIPKHTDPVFAAYLMHSPFVLHHAIATTTGVNHPRTSWKALSQAPISLPPLPEQRAIAYVLRAVQQAREATERAITAARELKKSLMRHLFTYGPVPVNASDRMEMQETEIGPIPAHWRVVRLGEVAEVRGGKRLPKGQSFADFPTIYPYIRVVDFQNGSVNTTNLKYLTEEQHYLLRRYIINKSDIYISIAGTIGLVGRVPDELDGAHLTENAARIILSDRRVDQQFLIFALSSQQGIAQINLRITKTSQPKLALARIKQIPIPLPPFDEQIEIARILQAVDRKIEAEEARRQALEALFKTLLHDLMTARRRLLADFIAQFAVGAQDIQPPPTDSHKENSHE